MQMRMIFAVMNTIIEPEKNFKPVQELNPCQDVCDMPTDLPTDLSSQLGAGYFDDSQ